MASVRTETIDEYVGARLMEPSKRRKGKKVSPATVNKELRHLQAALRKAHKWDFLPKMPDVEFVREAERLVEYVDAEDFQKLYEAADEMRRPRGFSFEPVEWWQGLLCFGFLTGWRVGEILALQWTDVDLDDRTARTQPEDNKGKCEAIVDLHPVVIEHLRRLVSFEPVVFPWPYHSRTLWADFTRLKAAAGVTFNGAFHRLRYGFASKNREEFDLDALQSMMRHKSSQTTRRYLSMKMDVNRTAGKIYVPPVLRKPAHG